jgi:hypothetical protein
MHPAARPRLAEIIVGLIRSRVFFPPQQKSTMDDPASVDRLAAVVSPQARAKSVGYAAMVVLLVVVFMVAQGWRALAKGAGRRNKATPPQADDRGPK